VALPDAVQYFRVRKLQEMGCNAMRTSHNPPTPELLDACDELGMLVLDETRMLSSNPDGLSQFENVVRRDRNHPSVQSTKSPGAVKVEVSSPGLTGAAVTITSRAVKLQPQVAVWEREVPSGTGVTGLWRPVRSVAAAQGGNPMALAGGEVDAVYTFRQDGSALTGLVESAGGGGFGPGGGGAAGGPIEDGKIDGSSISFRTGNTTYTGTIEGDQIALRRSGGAGGRGGGRGPAAVESGPRPAIGPPPDGTDPSFGGGGRGGQAPAPIVLKRAKR
jgi:beta-galactosidase